MKLLRAQLAGLLVGLGFALRWLLTSTWVAERPFIQVVGIGPVAIMLISATALLFFSFFALRQDQAGTIVIQPRSLYGKVFLAINRFWNRQRFDGNTSLCKTFWLTNLSILFIGIMLGLVALGALLVLKVGFWNLAKFVLILAAVVAILFAVVSGVVSVASYTRDKVEERMSSRGVRRLEIGGMIFFYTCLALALVWIMGKQLLIMLGLVAGALLLIIAYFLVHNLFRYAARRLGNTQLGIGLQQLYLDLCPRIVIRD